MYLTIKQQISIPIYKCSYLFRWIYNVQMLLFCIPKEICLSFGQKTSKNYQIRQNNVKQLKQAELYIIMFIFTRLDAKCSVATLGSNQLRNHSALWSFFLVDHMVRHKNPKRTIKGYVSTARVEPTHHSLDLTTHVCKKEQMNHFFY